MIWFANGFYEKMHPSLFCTIYPLCNHSGAGACPSCNWAKDRLPVLCRATPCMVLSNLAIHIQRKKHTSNLNRKCVKKKHYTYILVTILHRIFAHWVKGYIYLLFFASIYFKMQYSNMLLLLMALMQACSVNRNLSNAITIVCVIHWSLIRSWWGYGLSHSMWDIVNKT